MKPINILLIIAFLLLTLTFSFAQGEEKPKVDDKSEVNSTNSTQAINDKIEFKNETTNSILTITDEGNGSSSILIPAATSTPNDTDSKLYNKNGFLYFGADELNPPASGGTPGWTDVGSIVRLTTIGDKVGIGTNNPISKLSISGDGNVEAAIYSQSGITSGQGSEVYGIMGVGKGSWGVGIYGIGEFDSGIGVLGRALFFNGVGIQGEGITSGGYFTASFDGVGPSNDPGYWSYGVSGRVVGQNGRGVYGIASANQENMADSKNYGGYFSSNGGYGIGVYGQAHVLIEPLKSTAENYGGYFTSDGGNGRGIYGEATGTNGIGVSGSAPITGWAAYFSGRGYFSHNVGIGIEAPVRKLEVVAHSGGAVSEFYNTNVLGDGIRIKIGPNSNPDNDNDYIFFLDGDATAIGSVDGTGSGGVRYNTTSDARLKMNIKEYSNALETVSQIDIKKYERIANPGTEEIGVIAQELQKVYSQAVSGSPDNDVKTDPMMVDYSKLTPLLIKGMQEQQEIIEKQESSIKYQDERIKELEKQNTEIRSQNSVVSNKNEELENRLSKIESLLDGKRFTSASKY